MKKDDVYIETKRSRFVNEHTHPTSSDDGTLNRWTYSRDSTIMQAV